jgi:hypothetical protein
MDLEFLNEVIGTKHNINQPLSNMTTIAALVTGIKTIRELLITSAGGLLVPEGIICWWTISI